MIECAIEPVQPVVVNSRPYKRPDIDYAKLQRYVWCFPGRAIFAAPYSLNENERESGLILADITTSRRRLPVATCVCAHPDTGLLPNHTYIVHQAYAKRVQSLTLNDFELKKGQAELWMFGCSSRNVGVSIPVPSSVYALCEIDSGEGIIDVDVPLECPFELFETIDDSVAAGVHRVPFRSKSISTGNVVLSLPSRIETRNGLYLADSQRERPDIALAESVSPYCQHAKAGMMVWYQRRGLQNLNMPGYPDFATIYEDAIFAAVDIA